MRASTSAWLSGESLGMSAGCCSAAGEGAAAGEARAAPGATDAMAEAMAARRANSRREMPQGLAVLGLEVSSIKISVCVHGAGWPAVADRHEATESQVERQHRREQGAGKEALQESGQ